MTTAEPKYESLHPSKLALFHKNPRVGDVDAIATSLRAHGQYAPVVVNIGTHTGRPYEVLKGNHTLKAIRDLAEKFPDDERWQAVDCRLLDVDDDQAARIVAVDNRTSELGSFDEKVLAELLADLPDLEGTLYSEDELSDLRALLEEREGPDLENFDADSEEDDGEYDNGRSDNNRSLDVLREGYETSGSRMLMLAYPLPHFAWLQEKLEEVAESFGLKSNADTILRLISEKTGEEPPEIAEEEDEEAGDVQPDEAAIDDVAGDEFGEEFPEA